MSELSPSEAEKLARDIYLAQDPSTLSIFLARKDFCVSKKNKIQLKAEVGTRLINTKDGFGVCAIGGDFNKNQIFLIFRGTTMANYKADVFTDARIGIERSEAGLPVHIGFNHAFSSMREEIKKFLGKHSNITGTVHCIGHSLGGAVATLVAAWVVRNRINPVKLYTFGSPRVGTGWFTQALTRELKSCNINRVFHETDPVTMIPLYPFVHTANPGFSYFLPSSFPLTSGEAHKIKNYVKSVSKKSWKQIREVDKAPYTLEIAIENWLKSKTPVDSSSAKFWQWADAALIYVLKKIMMGSAITLQSCFIGAVTLADKIAYVLAKGIDLTSSVSIWVYHLMRKLMQALGMKIAKDVKDLTRAVLQTVLVRILEKMTRNAHNAIRKIVE